MGVERGLESKAVRFQRRNGIEVYTRQCRAQLKQCRNLFWACYSRHMKSKKTPKKPFHKGFQSLRGERHERWLRSVSACRSPDGVIRPQANLRSIKIPIEGGCGWEYEALLPVYRPLVETGPGSLLDYLVKLHQVGFRFFGASDRARNFRYRAALNPPGFADAAKAAFGDDTPLADGLSGMLSELCTKPRRTAGKAKYDKADYIRVLAGKLKPLVIGKAAPDAVLDWPERCASQVMAHFDDIFEATEDQGALLDVVSEALATLGIVAPLRAVADTLEPMVPANSTIEFDVDLASADTVLYSGTEALYAIMARMAQAIDGESAAAKAKVIQEQFVTGNATAWSWVLGRGWKYFCESDSDAVMHDYRIPEDRRAHVDAILAAAKAIPTPTMLFGQKNYSAFRQQVAGGVNSFITISLGRVDELRSVLVDSPRIEWPDTSSDEIDGLMTSLDLTADDLIVQIQREDDARRQVLGVLDKIAGLSVGAVTPADLDAVDEHTGLLTTIGARINQIRGRLKTEIRLNDQANLTSVKEKDLLDKLPSDIPRQKRLPRLDVCVTTPAARQAADLDALNSLRDFFREQIDALSPLLRDPFEALRDNHTAKIQKFNSRATLSISPDPDQMSARYIVSRIAKAARTGTDALRRKVARDLYERGFLDSLRHANAFMLNDRGEIFQSLMARHAGARHTVYRWGRSTVTTGQPISAWLDDLLSWTRDQVRAGGIHDGSRLNDMLIMEWMHAQWRLIGLPDTLPAPDLDPFLDHGVFLSSPLKLALQGEQATRTAVERLHYAVISEMRETAHRLFRKDVIARSVLKMAGFNTLHYIPRAEDGFWSPSKNITSASQSALAIYLQHSKDSRDQPRRNDQGQVKVNDVIADTLAHAGAAEVGFIEFLQQAPHAFGVAVPWDAGEPRPCVAIDKKGMPGTRLVEKSVAELVMPPKWHVMLNRALGHDQRLSWGDCQLVIDHRFQHDLSIDSDRIEGTSYPVSSSAYLVVPVTREELASKDDAFPFEPRVMSIDLGETGLAYAVVDFETGQQIKSGYIRIPTLRGVKRAGNRSTPWNQRKQKYNTRIDPTMSEIRKSAVGAVSHVIDSLMAEHRAIPLFENHPGGHVGGNREIARVYDHVSQVYLFSGVDAHASVRGHHWRTKFPSWEWPQFTVTKVAGDGSKTHGPLKFYPGLSINGYGSSQTCSCCGRNPVEALKERGGSSVVVAPNGELTVSNGVLRLQVPAQETSEERKRRRRRLERPSIHAAAKAGELKISEAMRILKSQIRQAPLSLQSRDSKQSRYVCAYTDCQARLHADTNAGINLTRFWISARNPRRTEAS